MYIDSKNKVTYTGTEGYWLKEESEANMTDMMQGLDGMDKSVLDKAEFETNKDGDYVLTISAKELGEAINDMNILSTMNMDELSFDEFNVTKGNLIYVFDKETVLLKQIKMDELTIDAKGKMDGQAYGFKMAMTGTFDFSKYNELEAKDYEIPQSVIDAAK